MNCSRAKLEYLGLLLRQANVAELEYLILLEQVRVSETALELD